jgi:hypothetical protein
MHQQIGNASGSLSYRTTELELECRMKRNGHESQLAKAFK